MDCNFITIEKTQLYQIKKLWEKLNEIHLNDSHYFKGHFKKHTFEERCEKFINISDDNIRIEVIIDGNEIKGYCISTIDKGIGEIDSIFIENKYQGFGYGNKLVENSVNWLKENNSKKIVVTVAEGHEKVFDFYKRFKFFPRLTYLEMQE